MRTSARPRAARLARPLVAAFVAALALPLAVRADDPPLRFPEDRPFDVTRISLELDVDLEGRSISGVARILARSIRPGLSEVVLDAVDLEVLEVRDQDRRALRFEATGEALRVRLAEPLATRGSVFQLEVRYRTKPGDGLNFFAPNESEPDVPLQVWSQNETLGARHWFPCVDTPEERQATEIAATVPQGFQVVSNGTLLSREAVDGGRVRWRYSQAFAHPAYLVSLVVGRFHVARDEWEGIPLGYYVPEDRAADVERTFSRTKDMLTFFSRRLGVRYPYPKYDQVVVEQFSFGGMENTGATTLNERTLHDERAHLDHSSEPLIAHELAHQWFGDLVTCRDWGHIWLNEGFASFLEACWDEHAHGPDAYLENLLGKAGGARRGGLQAPLVRERWRTAQETFGGGTYPKGAFVLHMLRRELGEEDFWEGLRRYLERYRERPAETFELRRVLEETSGRSLGLFFQQWTARPGHPELEVRPRWRAEERLLDVSVRQTQKGDPFVFALPLAIYDASGARRLVTVAIDGKEARLLLPLDESPLGLSVDPGLELLYDLKLEAPRSMHLAVLSHAPSLVERVQAIEALSGDGHRSVRDALALALAEDPSWRVRAEAARALGRLPGEEPRAALLDALRVLSSGSDDDAEVRARARVAVVSALSVRDAPEVAGALVALLPEEPSYHVLDRIAQALGDARDDASRAALEALSDMDPHQGGVARSALRSLGSREELSTLPCLLRHAERGRPYGTRAAALDALGTIGARKELPAAEREHIVAHLAAALAEPSARIRRVAAGALREIGREAEATREALAALAEHDPDERVRSQAKAAVDAIRKGEPEDAQLRALRDELRRAVAEADRLRERLERVEARVGEQKTRGF